MYSNSNSYLGGANAQRQPPFGSQQAYGQQQNSYPQQQNGLGGGLRPQYTGFPGQQQPQLQPQYTGYPQQNAQQYQQSQQAPPPLATQATGYPQQNMQQYQQLQQQLAQQQTAFQPPQQQPSPAPRVQPQPTGMTSAQMAASFKGSSSPAPAQSGPKSSTSNKVPAQRLSFITADDQSKFAQLFMSATGSDQAMSGDKARDLLVRSRIPGDALSQIWTLSDTTKSGQLLFPEFALAMYLCNLKMNGKTIPSALPDKIKNEVAGMVDLISFGIVDDQPSRSAPSSNAPSFDQPMQSAFASQPVQQPQPQQPSNSQLLSQLVSQPTGFQQPQAFQPQPTGFQQQQTGYQQPQQTGFQQNQQTGYQGPRPPMPPMPTGFQQQQQATPLNAQPTGRPGQWGLVNAPSSGLPNLEAMQQQMMPQQGREGGFSSTGLRGNASVPWAVTKDEKKMYDGMFRAWDGFGKGFITGSQAIEIFSQSGLLKSDLEKIWTLSDPNNRGRLDLDEFAVAMHIIYRALNGYPVPNRLPPELVPPSTRNFNDSVGSIKSLLSRDAEERKNSGSFLNPQTTSYAKNHSFANGHAPGPRKDATVFKNNDDDVGYRSSARRRLGADGGRSPSPSSTSSPPPEMNDDLPLDEIRKKIREKQVMLDAIDFKEEGQADEDDMLDRKDRRDADDLYRRIRQMQEDIDGHPNAGLRGGDSGAERRALKRQLQQLTDRLPDLASQVRRAEKAIADTRLELFRMKDAKANPNAASAIVGTGPGGAVTESDRVKARAKAMMQQRSAALAGRPMAATDDSGDATRRFEEESSKVSSEKDNNDRMVRDVEDSVGTYSRGVEDTLKEGAEDSATEHERRRWDDGLGVEDEVKDFIFELQRSSRSSRVRKEDIKRDTNDRGSRTSQSSAQVEARTDSPKSQNDSAARSSPAPTNYSSYKTGEDRAAFIKQQAEQRMAERLAALGLRAPSKPAENAQQRQEREHREAEERKRQAEAEDAKREQERQRRLEDEQIVPPSAAKKPPPPPSRGKRSDSITKKAEQEAQLKQQQEASEAETRNLENEEQRQEEELRKEREASEARRSALEEQVRQGKLKRKEEKRQREASQRETKENEDRLAAQRAELEAARQREQELQRQLEAMDDSSDDDDGPEQLTPQDATPSTSSRSAVTSPPESTASPPTSIAIPPPSAPPSIPTISSPPISIPPTESRNPYHKLTSPAATTTAADTNPFHRLSLQQSQSQSQPPAAPLQPQRTASRFDTPTSTDDWGAPDATRDDSDEDESDGPAAGSAKHLASILFGTMAPPRPLSRNVTGATPSPGPGSAAMSSPVVTAPSPPPSVPGGFEDDAIAAPAAPPPPPPPMPSMSAPSPPPMPSMPTGANGDVPVPPPPPPMSGGGGGGMSALMGAIQAGKGPEEDGDKG